MQKLILLGAILLITALVVFGCSGGGGVTTPQTPTGIGHETSSHEGGTSIAGAWQVSVDLQKQTIEAVQTRTADMMLNVVGFMEPPALSKLSIDFGTLVIDFVAETIAVDVLLTHPLSEADNVFQGFDVRGIVFGPKLANADGFTAVLNPADFDAVPFGYQDGLLGVPNSTAGYDASYWPYKYFCDGLTKDADLATFLTGLGAGISDHRGKFTEGTTNIRHYDLDWSGLSAPITMLVFNYAVYANFDWPVGVAPFTTDDYPITTANSAEAICVKTNVTGDSLSYSGGSGSGALSMDITIWDWQGFNSTEVTVSDGTLDAPTSFFGPGSDPFTGVFQLTDAAFVPTSSADLELLITATDNSVTYGDAWFFGLLQSTHPYFNLPVANYWKTAVDVGECMGEPVNIEVAPYLGTWADLLDVDTACANEVSTVGISTMEWTHSPSTTSWNSGNSGGVYENNMDTILIGPEILVPSTGAVQVDFHYDLDLDGSTDDWLRFGYVLNGVYTVAFNTNTSSTDDHKILKMGGKTPGDSISWAMEVITDAAGGGGGTGCTLWDVTTTVFDPGDSPQVYPGGPPDPANDICSTGSPILTWNTWLAPYYIAQGYFTTDVYGGNFDFRWGGGTGEFYSWCFGPDGWQMPNYQYGWIWWDIFAHRPCNPAETLDMIIPFGDYTVPTAVKNQLSAYYPTWGTAPGGAVYWQQLDNGTSTERMVLQWCNVGQIGTASRTCNYRVIFNGGSNTDRYDVRIEWVDIGDPGTTNVGAYFVWNGMYSGIQCDPADWASFDGTSVIIDQPDIY